MHRTTQLHTVCLSVNVCRLAADARVAVNGDFVNVLVNACHVLLFDKSGYFYYGRKNDVPRSMLYASLHDVVGHADICEV